MRLRTEGLSWDLDGRRIVDGVELAVDIGEVVGLIGPNGSGKSSLLRLLAGLRRPTSGDVLLDGRSLASLSRRQAARRIAFVEQAAVTDQNPTVAEVVELGRTPHRRSWAGASSRDRAVLERVARQTEIEPLLNTPYGRLSGGERQRVQIARGFAQEPEVMILDEPTNHLDIKYQLSLLGLVRALVRDTSAAAIVALHDLNLAAMYCDRIIVLRDGAVTEAGPPAHTITESMLSEVFGVRSRVRHDDGVYVRLSE
ncbi:ABC transporter ATP-binding protein [Gordonia aichiensis]|uniref:ABC transporter ATP-binding protein n=1 Tax=Gordonia aichiensis TaxID=36820 RepID=UPI0032671506